MDLLQIMLVTVVTKSVQTSSTLMSMETGMKLIVLKRHKKIKRHKKLSSMSPKPVSIALLIELQKYQKAET